MTGFKNVPYKSLKVHTGAAPADTPPAAGRRDESRHRFAEFVKRRPSAPACGAAPSNDNGPAPALRRTEDAVTEDKPDERSAQPTFAALARADRWPYEPASPRAAGPVAPAGGVAQADPQGHHVVQYIAKTVTRFCNDDAVRTSDSWQIRIVMRPDVLADTTLHLGLSPHWLLLRFETHDESAKALVCRHQKSLEEMLEEAVMPRRDVSISFD